MKGKNIFVLLIFVSVLFTSCNWNILTDHVDEITGSNGSSNIAVFTGTAPMNLSASKGVSKDSITVSFSPVSGATYYNIYRAEYERGKSPENMDSLKWSLIDVVESSSSRITYKDTIPMELENGLLRDELKFYYKVKAGSDYADAFLSVKAMDSEIVEGWTLSAPRSITATQGTYMNRIEIVWPQVYGTDGYNLYYSTDSSLPQNMWILAAEDIPYSKKTETVGYTYYLKSTDKSGEYVYFAVESIGPGSYGTSDWSTYARGYTFKEGAPEAPDNAVASKADYANQIVVSWDKLATEEGSPAEYIWEVFRNDKGDAEPVVSFTRNQLPENVEFDGTTYHFTDTDSALQPNTTYTYTISARYDLIDEETGESEPFNGKPAYTDGFLLSPPVDVKNTIKYPSGSDKGGFTLTVAAPMGWDSSYSWTYKVQGRLNDGVGNVGAWTDIMDSIPIKESTEISIDYALYPYNDFRISVSNGTDISSYGNTIEADVPAPIDFTVESNTYTSSISANSNGVFPVLIRIKPSEGYASYSIECIDTGNTKSVSFSEASAGLIAMAASDSPSEPFKIYKYRATGESYFGRKIVSETMNGYGAITGDTFIKYMQVFAMKPWEFVDKQLLGSTLSDKWRSNKNGTTAQQISWKIAQGNKSGIGDQMDSLTNGTPLVASDSSSNPGTISYNAKMKGSLTDLGGLVDFGYTNFGEKEELKNTGSYSMNVDTGGNGSVTGEMNFSGMYPAVVTFDEGRISVKGKQFSGEYTLKQDNGTGIQHVNSSQSVT